MFVVVEVDWLKIKCGAEIIERVRHFEAQRFSRGLCSWITLRLRFCKSKGSYTT
jgi:hypothetical protein